jgi:hypothetical protein
MSEVLQAKCVSRVGTFAFVTDQPTRSATCTSPTVQQTTRNNGEKLLKLGTTLWQSLSVWLSVCSLFFSTLAYSKLCFALINTYSNKTCLHFADYRAAKFGLGLEIFLNWTYGLSCWVTGWTQINWVVTTVGTLGNWHIIITVVWSKVPVSTIGCYNHADFRDIFYPFFIVVETQA